jgi:hypothetical protein
MTRLALSLVAASAALVSTSAFATWSPAPSVPAPTAAQIVMFTNSSLVSLPGAQVVGSGGVSCQDPRTKVTGVCGSALSFNTSAGALTVTATDGKDVDLAAMVFQGGSSTGLGVVEGFNSGNTFKVTDLNYSLDEKKENLKLSFATKVNLSQLYFFADDRTNTLKELDKFDGFTISVDGGAWQEFTFGTQFGLPVNLSLTGKTFTLGYANKTSIEDYFLAGVGFTAVTPAIPEPSTYALMGLGLVGLALAARRQRRA